MDRIFSKRTIRQFWELHPDSEQYLKTWFETVLNANRKSPHDVKNNFANASILKENRIVFAERTKSEHKKRVAESKREIYKTAEYKSQLSRNSFRNSREN